MSSSKHDDERVDQPALQPSLEDLAGLNERFSRLEDDLDEFVLVFGRLAEARRNDGALHRRVSSVDRSQYYLTSQHASETVIFGTQKKSCAGARCSDSATPGTTWLLCLVVMAGAVAGVLLQWVRPQKNGVARLSGKTQRRTAAEEEPQKIPCDVAFLAHPGSILSAFALWLPEDRPLRRWRGSLWMIPAWPFILLASLWYMFVSPRISGPFFAVDRFIYKGVGSQVWLSRALGYQFMVKALRRRIARGIEATVREADRAGVSVLGLGALNKAEFINRGGEDVLDAFQPRKTRVVHGNTLTAAVVIQNVRASALGSIASAPENGAEQEKAIDAASGEPETQCVFLTGATSKVGRAVALGLAIEGFNVVCCTSSDERFAALQGELALLLLRRNDGVPPSSSSSSSTGDGNKPWLNSGRWEGRDVVPDSGGCAGNTGGPGGFAIGEGRTSRGGRLLRAKRVHEGVHHRLWVVGKFDVSVRLHLPLNASAVVFAVPCPLEGHRRDVSAVTGGVLRMDIAACSPRRFHVLLPFDQLYACHAAALVHYRMGWTHHEVGKVDVRRMASTLQAAERCGFTVPPLPRHHHQYQQQQQHHQHHYHQQPCSPPTTVVRDDKDGDKNDDGNDDAPEGGPRVGVLGGEMGGGGAGVEASIPCLRKTPPVCHDMGAVAEGRRKGESLYLPRPLGMAGGILEAKPCVAAAVAAINSGGGGGGGVRTAPRDNRYTSAYPLCRRQRHGEGDGVDSMDAFFSSRFSSSALLSAATDNSSAECRARAGSSVVKRPSSSSLEGVIGDNEAVLDGVGALPSFCRVVVVGAGASGLSTAACLRSRGEASVLVLERSNSVCGAWNSQYEGLHITTRRAHCGLPGWSIPWEGLSNEGGAEVSAPDFVRYLRSYRRRFDVDVVTNAEVVSADRGDSFTGPHDGVSRAGGVIRVQVRRDGSVWTIRCDHLIVATGKNASPRMPSPILQSVRGFSGEILHSSKVTGLAALAKTARAVCIVGMGNSACDLAVALVENGAQKVHISTRSAPPIIMRQWGPLSLEWISRAVQYLPARVNDQVLAMFAAAKWGKGWRQSVFPKELQQTWGACTAGRIPCIDKGGLSAGLLSGRIKVHGPIDWANDRSLRFRFSGAVESCDTVIIATGFETAHERWLDPELLRDGVKAGVHMVGFYNGRALLPLRQIGTDARRLAARLVPRKLGAQVTF